MTSIPGVNPSAAVRALERAGFRVIRQGRHIVMSNGSSTLAGKSPLVLVRSWPRENADERVG
jgi:predicted RNA binding protein YcfA (HicA-like mRNA interferase family)